MKAASFTSQWAVKVENVPFVNRLTTSSDLWSLVRQLLHPRWHFLVRLNKKRHEIFYYRLVLVIEERCRQT